MEKMPAMNSERKDSHHGISPNVADFDPLSLFGVKDLVAVVTGGGTGMVVLRKLYTVLTVLQG